VETGEDWLDGDVRDAEVVPVPEGHRKAAVEFAQIYRVFSDDERGRALLEHWVKTIEAHDVSPSASVQEYAYWEGRRQFVRGIQRQIELAKTEDI
jgi:hypothetical protein